LAADPGVAQRSLVLASGNAGKLRELTAMLAPLGWSVRPQSEWDVPDAVEDGLSFIENALIKARHAARLTGLPALGDDSGLVVDALGGRPGIYSARYAGSPSDDDANNRKLMAALIDTPPDDRAAHFYCAMAMVRQAEDPAPLLSIGRWDGRITTSPSGAGGFGYDPLFEVPGRGCTSAELPAGEKNRLSHRGQALAQMVRQMKENFGA
jgi:XTP/dITP diphosphohydrolase